MQISITSHREPEPLDLAAFQRLAAFVLDREDVPDLAELSIAVVEMDEMANLNERYRGVSGPTDVLSFGCDDPCAVEGDEPITLGDVVVAPALAESRRPNTATPSKRSSTCCWSTVSCTCWATNTRRTTRRP